MTVNDDTFGELMRRVVTGDSMAAAELVRQYEPEIRRTIRVRLTDSHLRRVVDSMDICQSVLGNFFLRASHGEFELNRSSDLVALLTVMVRNKVIDHARRAKAVRRGQGRIEYGGESALDRLVLQQPGPDRIAADRNLLGEVRRRLSPDERHLAEQRAAGCSWDELARQRGQKADALRKKLSRALDRVAQELGIEEPADGA